MPKKTKKQLKAEAKKLGIKVGKDWTVKQLEEAIRLAKEPEPTSEPLKPKPMATDTPKPEPMAPEPKPKPEPVVATPVPKPAPAPPRQPTPVAPPPKSNRYVVLWTITYKGQPIHASSDPNHPQVVELNDAAARSLLKQEAVVHVDDYDAYRRAQQKVVPGVPVEHPARVPSGAGNWKCVGDITRNGEVLKHGTVHHFSAQEVANLTKPGMVALAFPDEGI